MIIEKISKILSCYNGILERFSARKHWQIEFTLMSTILLLFFAFPSYDLVFGEFLPSWNSIYMQAAHPLTNFDYDPSSHESKQTFRLFVPLLIRYTNLNIIGVILVQHIVGIISIFIFMQVVAKITKDRMFTMLLTLAYISIGTAKASFISISTLFDGFAFFFLLLSLRFSSFFIVFFSLTCSAWIDERGLIALSLIFVWYCMYGSKKQLIAILLAWIGYFTLRFYLVHTFGLNTVTGAIGLSTLVDQINNAPMGIWTGMEGFWIFFILSLTILWVKKQWYYLVMLTGSVIIIITVALLVADISRSMFYLLPAIIIALRIVKENETSNHFNKLVWMTLGLSVMFPAYVVGGVNTLSWQYPLPLQIMRLLAN